MHIFNDQKNTLRMYTFSFQWTTNIINSNSNSISNKRRKKKLSYKYCFHVIINVQWIQSYTDLIMWSQ